MRKVALNSLKASPLLLLTYALCSDKNRPEASQLERSSPIFKSRSQHVQDVRSNPNYDVLVIGGGASGAGVAIDASTRGLRTLVIEKEDFGSGTSSKSTKLIHGGVRYLEQVFQLSFDSISSRIEKFRLVTEAIRERGTMIRNANYMNDKVSFVIPCTNSFWSLYYYIGSIVYYAIYWAASPPNTPKFNFPYFLNRFDLRDLFPYISEKYQSGIVYEDGCFNDSRMLFVTLLTSTLSKQEHKYLPKEHVPANMLNKAEFQDFMKDETGKIVGAVFTDRLTGEKFKINAKYVVNCTGVWADKIRLKDNPNKSKRICIVAGSHITYNQKIASSKFGLCLPSSDGRILLVVPWLGRVIAGTTQRKLDEPQLNPTISVPERQFIQNSMGEVMEKLSSSSLIDLEVARWTGLRPLVIAQEGKNTKDIARSHVIEKSQSGLYSLMGGKWTTYRKMGEDLVNQIAKDQQSKGNKVNPSVSENVLLVGSSSAALQDSIKKQHGILGQYLYKTYGSMALQIIKGDLTPIQGRITKAQLEYLIKNEMVTDVEDVLLRRSRFVFLNNREETLKIIPVVAEMILKERSKDGKIDEKQLKQMTNKGAQNIIKYEFA